jgi:N-acetylmuramic acid 6-phosphate (MurNAc-6-P) etherase
MLAFIDASETVPTFGASYKEVRAFILDAKDEHNSIPRDRQGETIKKKQEKRVY